MAQPVRGNAGSELLQMMMMMEQIEERKTERMERMAELKSKEMSENRRLALDEENAKSQRMTLELDAVEKSSMTKEEKDAMRKRIYAKYGFGDYSGGGAGPVRPPESEVKAGATKKGKSTVGEAYREGGVLGLIPRGAAAGIAGLSEVLMGSKAGARTAKFFEDDLVPNIKRGLSSPFDYAKTLGGPESARALGAGKGFPTANVPSGEIPYTPEEMQSIFRIATGGVAAPSANVPGWAQNRLNESDYMASQLDPEQIMQLLGEMRAQGIDEDTAMRMLENDAR